MAFRCFVVAQNFDLCARIKAQFYVQVLVRWCWCCEVKIDKNTRRAKMPNAQRQPWKGNVQCLVVGRESRKLVVQMKSGIVELEHGSHRGFTRGHIQTEFDRVFTKNVHRTTKGKTVWVVGAGAVFDRANMGTEISGSSYCQETNKDE